MLRDEPCTAFATVGRPVLPNLTAICDEFGGPIPVGEFALIGGEEIGREIIRAIGGSKAILMKNHGVFTIGKTATEALKSAVMVEDAARTMYYAFQLGDPVEIDPQDVAKLHLKICRRIRPEMIFMLRPCSSASTPIIYSVLCWPKVPII